MKRCVLPIFSCCSMFFVPVMTSCQFSVGYAFICSLVCVFCYCAAPGPFPRPWTRPVDAQLVSPLAPSSSHQGLFSPSSRVQLSTCQTLIHPTGSSQIPLLQFALISVGYLISSHSQHLTYFVFMYEVMRFVLMSVFFLRLCGF